MTTTGLPRPLRATAYWAQAYHRTWRRALVPSVLGPALSLVVMGKVLGGVVADGPGALGRLGVDRYLDFVGPALVSVAALTTASHEAADPVYRAMRQDRTYAAMRSTPLRVVDIVTGHLLWALVRVALTTTLMALFLAALGGLRSAQAVLLVPLNVALGASVATGLAAYAARQTTSGNLLAWQRFGVVPMMLFAGVYFPVDQLDGRVQAVVHLTPLWHAIEVARPLAAGTSTVPAALPHLAYLLALAGAGGVAAVRTFTRLLED